MAFWEAPSLTALCTAFLIFGLETVVLRFVARRRNKVAILSDDWLSLLSLAAFVSACGCLFYCIDIKAIGYSLFQFTKEEIQARQKSYSKASVGFGIASIFCLAFTKASALLFCKRLFCKSDSRALNNVIIASLAVVTCWMVAFAMLSIFQCGTHFSALWDGTQVKYCKIIYPVFEAMAISDVILDVWILVLPIYPITKLKTTKVKKIAILGLFAVACLGLAASIARLVIVLEITNIGIVGVHRGDIEMYMSKACFFWALEMGVSVVAINLPSIWMFLRSMLPDEILKADTYEEIED